MGNGSGDSDNDDYYGDGQYDSDTDADASSSADDDDDSSYSSSSSSTTPTPTPSSSIPPVTAPPSHLPGVIDVLVIVSTFINGDKLVKISGSTTRICFPTPLPSALHTIDSHKQQLASPASSSSSTSSSSSDSTYSSSKGISFGSLNTQMSMWSETESLHSTKPTSASSSSSMTPLSKDPTAAPDSDPNSSHASHPPIGAIVVIPLVLIAALLGAFMVWRRKRKARRAAEAAGMTQEMKMTRGPEDGLPQYTPTVPGSNTCAGANQPLMLAPSGLATTTTGTTTSLTPATSASHTAVGATEPAQPVILNSNMGSAYFTGIDTSDAMSMTSNTNNMGVAGNRMSYDARSMNSSDEPPPPYRPRSVPPISRETSLRQPNAPHNISQMLAPLSEGTLSTYELRDEDFRVADGMRNPFEGGGNAHGTPLGDGMNNPFDDPDDESIVSDESTPVSSPLVSRDEAGHAAMGGSVPSQPRPGHEC
ncbi:hypothetical protein NA57DRAFT_70303 [Rhizodiscina lignyota]|uniref:Uncharacterized protein n=1 Tax=Rhizodiscina lignyota TaxID=1504668 RepID=A0A9P4IM63_9PEZI|nr:hypothetical protein NA57DRAFT_70303 [Rhizodiscina lignyota]